MNIVTRFLSAPQRSIQILIWVMLAAVLVTVIPLSGHQLDPSALTSAHHATTSVASGDTLVLAGPSVGPAGAQADQSNPTELLPAYRWRNSMELHADYGWRDGVPALVTGLADLQFALASFVWWLLLAIMNFAMSLDIVASFTHTINSFFATTFNGLESSGVFLIIGIAVFAMAAMAALRQKLGQAFKMVLSAFLVLALIQSLGTAAAADKNSATATSSAGYVSPAGTPAWLAETGNKYVNEIAFTVSSFGGAVSGITNSATTGQAGVGDASTGGTTCAYYNERLYATYADRMAAKGGVSSANAAALAQVSFMWQRSMYDNWAAANFADPVEGGRAACHLLERNRQTDYAAQAAIAGTDDESSPYYGMGDGPFKPVTDNTKNNQAMILAWVACNADDGKSSVRVPWDDIANMGDGANTCEGWFTSDESGGLTDRKSGALGWKNGNNLDNDTLGKGGANGDKLNDVHDMVWAFYGHNASQRFLSGGSAIVTAGLYAYAFAGPAVGVLLSQFVLLFMLILLPWTLLVLALPSKDGSRNAVGKKMLRLTMMAFGGKIIFLVVMGLTLTLMSALFSLTQSQPELSAGASAAGGVGDGYTMWNLIIPAAVIFVVKMVLKGAGLGNLMGLSGAMGFATAAVTQGKDGKALKSMASGATNGTLKKGTTAAKSAISKRFGGKALANEYKARAAAAALKNGTGRHGGKPLDADLANRLRSGQMNVWQAQREQRLRGKALPDDLARRVANGEMSMRAAKALHKGQQAYSDASAERRAEARASESGGETMDRLAAMAGGAPLGAGQLDPHAGATPRLVDAGEIAAENRDARAAADLASATMTVGDAQWSAIQTQALGDNFDQMVAATRTDGLTGPLSAAQVTAARAGAQERVGKELAANVIVGDSGAPALVMPKFGAGGKLTVPREALTDPKLAAQVLSNPLILLEPHTVQRDEGEQEPEYHTRLTLALMDNDLVSSHGDVVDVLSELKVDRYAADFDDQVMHLAKRIYEGENVLRDVRRQPTIASDSRVSATVEWIARESRQIQSRPDIAAEIAFKAASDHRKQASAAIADLRALRTQIDVSVSDPVEAGRARTKLLGIAESQIEDLTKRLQGSIAELEFTAANASAAEGPELEEARAALQRRVEYVTRQGEDMRQKVAVQVAAIINATDSDSSRDELVTLTDTLSSQLSDLERELAATEVAATRKTAARQAVVAGQELATKATAVRLPAERPVLQIARKGARFTDLR